MPRFLTYTTNGNSTPRVATAAKDVPEDYADYIWHFADNAAAAVEQHDAKLDECNSDINTGVGMKETY